MSLSKGGGFNNGWFGKNNKSSEPSEEPAVQQKGLEEDVQTHQETVVEAIDPVMTTSEPEPSEFELAGFTTGPDETPVSAESLVPNPSTSEEPKVSGFSSGGFSTGAGWNKPKVEQAPTQQVGSIQLLDEHEQLKQHIHARLIEEIDLAQLGGQQDDSQLKERVRQAIAQLVLEETPDLMTQVERDELSDAIFNETMGLGPLESLLQDPSISEIMINGPKMVFVERNGKLTLSDTTIQR